VKRDKGEAGSLPNACRDSGKGKEKSDEICALPRKRKSLTVQGDFDKIIDVGRTELCFLSVYMVNVGLWCGET
jgi:hypothetical protein